MNLNSERTVLFVSVIFIFSVFGYATYIYINPPVKTWEAKIFDHIYSEKSDQTRLLSYQNGFRKFQGKLDVIIGETYLITYRELGSRGGKIISIQKIS